MPVTAPTIRPPEVLQRLGHLIQLAQLPAGNWMAERDLRPCPCGNRVYVVTSGGLILCRDCPRPKYAAGQTVIDWILMPARQILMTKEVYHAKKA